MDIQRTTGFYMSANYRVLDYEFRQTNDLYIICCGEEHFSSPRVIGPYTRTGYHLHIITSGSGYLSVNGETKKLTRGQLFLLRPNVETTYWADKDDPWSYYWIQFDGLTAAAFLEKAGFPPGTFVRDSILPPDDFVQYLEKILKTPELTHASELKRIGTLYSLMGVLIESYHTQCYSQKTHYDYSPKIYVAHAIDYIHHNYATATVSKLASYIGINRSYLASTFKRLVGISPQEYLLNFRMEESVRLLTEGEMPIKDIAASVGYDNPLTFSKIFKNRYGVSPQNYRKEHKS
ncbi:MAG: AraC family transcriptional regulator [Lachnospiraceae bacterium]|nr:AraC family transcriptional regulator [Lachnospiraceae bacterium]